MMSAIFFQPWSGQACKALGDPQPLWSHKRSIRPITGTQVVRPGVDPATGSTEQWAGLWEKPGHHFTTGHALVGLQHPLQLSSHLCAPRSPYLASQHPSSYFCS